MRNGPAPPWQPLASFEFSVNLSPQQATVQAARTDIETIIANDIGLGAKFLRLSFHDCVGGCDGCVDLENPENGGLLEPIEALQPVVQQHGGGIMSRADVWVLAALTACDVLQGPERIDYPLRFVGRRDCEVANNRCFDEEGHEVPCTEDRGPHRHIPPADITTRDLFAFFDEEFNMSTKETVALMGAHTIGVANRETSGFDGPNGWLLNNELFDNEYYAELVGGTSINDPLDVLINTAPGWQRNLERNGDLPDQPNRFIWTGFPGGTKIIMLNSDIAIVRDLNEENMVMEDGRSQIRGTVLCDFVGPSRCPHAAMSFQFAAEYTFDNLLWLRDFRDVMDKMTTKGYDADMTCPLFDVCPMSQQVDEGTI